MTHIKDSKSKFFQFSVILLLFICLGYTTGFSQSAFVSTYNESSGSNGKVSYTIGQSYTIKGIGSNGETVNGIQQPFSIYTLGVDDASLDIDVTIFPNPTYKELILKTGDSEMGNFSFSLYDMNGVLIKTKQIRNSETLIQMSGLQAATYMLNVMNSGKIVKSFKVIKR